MSEIARLYRRYRSGEISPLEVIERHLERASTRGAELNAFTQILEFDARWAAGESVRRYRDGRPLSPLDGVPVTLKDLIQMRILAGFSVDGQDYARALAVRESVEAAFCALASACDAIVLPTLPGPATREDGGGGDRHLAAAPLHTSVFNLLGVPAITLPMGRTREGGMPLGVQVAGLRGAEAIVLEVARRIERLRGRWRPPTT